MFYCWFSEKNGRSGESIRLNFYPSDMILDMDHTEMTLAPDKVEKYVDEDYFNMENEEDKKRFDYLCSLEVSKITFTRVVNDFSCKYLV